MAGPKKRNGGAKPPGDEDDALWNRIAESVTPLRRKASIPTRPKPAPKPDREDEAHAAPKPARAVPPTLRQAAPSKPADRSAGDFAGIAGRQADRLKRGRLPIDRRIDLHGMTRAEAHLALQTFLLSAANSGARCVLVITGKGSRSPADEYGRHGEGTIRSALPGWLNMPPVRDHVLGFNPAQPKDGGSGAFYVLLKRRRDT